MLQRLCAEVLVFAKLAELPTRVVEELEAASKGGTIHSSLLPVLPDDFQKPAAKLGRIGGLKGGHARAANMSARARRESAKRAAQVRWGRK